MTAQEMINQAHDFAWGNDERNGTIILVKECEMLRKIIRHLCDPEQHPYPMTSPEL